MSADHGLEPAAVAALDQAEAVFSAWLDRAVAAFPGQVAEFGRTVALVSLGEALRGIEPDRLAIVVSIAVARLADSAPMALYFCPTSGEVESPCHSGFDVCCERPDLHRPVTGSKPGDDR